MRRVQDCLETNLSVRGALVIANLSDNSFEADHDRHGEPIKAFGTKKFWRVLSMKREQTGAHAPSPEVARVTRAVSKPGSTSHLEP